MVARRAGTDTLELGEVPRDTVGDVVDDEGLFRCVTSADRTGSSSSEAGFG
jgi:hypothetical protein